MAQVIVPLVVLTAVLFVAVSPITHKHTSVLRLQTVFLLTFSQRTKLYHECTQSIIGSVGAKVVFSYWEKCVTSLEMVCDVIVNTYWVQVVG